MPSHTVEELEAEIGRQLKTLRLKQNIDQATLASRAGCGLSALKNLESGKGSTLRTLIPVVRAPADARAPRRYVRVHRSARRHVQAPTGDAGRYPAGSLRQRLDRPLHG